MESYRFDFPLKAGPFDFIVKEEATHPEGENYFKYLLVKRNLNTNDLVILKKLKELGVKDYGYAGLKDRYALTVQSVSLDRFVGKKLIFKEGSQYFALLFKGKLARRIKVGALRGNRFFVAHRGRLFFLPPLSINYYDGQRLGKNVARGRKTLKEKPSKKWERIFWINAYQSHLFNLLARRVLTLKAESFNASRGVEVLRLCRVEEGRVSLVFPCSKDRSALIEFLNSLRGIKLPLPGYKVKPPPWLERDYLSLLERGGVTPEDFRRWRLKGDYRPLVVEVDQARRYPKNLSFFLPKGAFATVLIKFAWVLEVAP